MSIPTEKMFCSTAKTKAPIKPGGKLAAGQVLCFHLTFSMLSNIVKSIWQPTDVFFQFFSVFS